MQDVVFSFAVCCLGTNLPQKPRCIPPSLPRRCPRSDIGPCGHSVYRRTGTTRTGGVHAVASGRRQSHHAHPPRVAAAATFLPPHHGRWPPPPRRAFTIGGRRRHSPFTQITGCGRHHSLCSCTKAGSCRHSLCRCTTGGSRHHHPAQPLRGAAAATPASPHQERWPPPPRRASSPGGRGRSPSYTQIMDGGRRESLCCCTKACGCRLSLFHTGAGDHRHPLLAYPPKKAVATTSTSTHLGRRAPSPRCVSATGGRGRYLPCTQITGGGRRHSFILCHSPRPLHDRLRPPPDPVTSPRAAATAMSAAPTAQAATVIPTPRIRRRSCPK